MFLLFWRCFNPSINGPDGDINLMYIHIYIFPVAPYHTDDPKTVTVLHSKLDKTMIKKLRHISTSLSCGEHHNCKNGLDSSMPRSFTDVYQVILTKRRYKKFEEANEYK